MIYACEHHDQLLSHWREARRQGLALAHVDFHDDLRGLLVGRRGARVLAELGPVDAGNFLAHAVVEGRVQRLRWIHGRIGGRAWDAGIVRYESDLLGWRHRRRVKHRPACSLAFEEILMEHWGGLAPGELLSVDWDCFASILQDPDGLDGRVEAFFEHLGSRAPEHAWVAYSPEYVRATLEPYREFVARLAGRLGQRVEWLSPGLREGRLSPTGVPAAAPRNLVMRLVLLLRRLGVYF